MDWLASLEPDHLKVLMGDALSNQVTQFGIAFCLAALIHASRVKKEIALQGEGIRIAFNNLAEVLKADLTTQSKRIAVVEDGVTQLNEHVKQIDGRLAVVESK